MNSSDLSKQIIRQIMDDIKKNKTSIDSVTTLILKTMELVEKIPKLSGREKKECVVNVLVEISKGLDGIEGTEDDLIPSFILEGLKFMLLNNIVENTIDIIVAATKGILNINAATAVITTAAPICCGIFSKLFSK